MKTILLTLSLLAALPALADNRFSLFDRAVAQAGATVAGKFSFVYVTGTDGTLGALASGTDGKFLQTHSTTSPPTWEAAVTSVGLSMPSQFAVTNSPVTTTGTLTAGWNTQTANYLLAGPTTGAAAAPTFRALVMADLFAAQNANKVLAGPTTGGDAAPTFRALVAGDVPTLNQDTTGKAAKADALNSATTVVNVSAAAAPSAGQVLTGVDSTHATWQTASAGAASDLLSATTTVNVSAAAAPSAGQVLTGVDSTHATWQTPASASLSVTTKGDLQTYSTAAARLPVGADGKVLVADSTQTTGLAYAGGWVQISKITTAASQATVDFTSIPATYTDLRVVYQAHSNVTPGANEALSVKLNNDGTAANYTITQYLLGNGTSTAAGTIAASTSGLFINNAPGAGAPASHTADGELSFSNYSGTTFYKHMRHTGTWVQAAGATQEAVVSNSGVWKNTAAITRLTFSVPTTFTNGSVFTLYGQGTP